MTQRDDGTARCQSHVFGARGQEGKIGVGIEHLPRIPKGRIEQGHVAHPHGGEAMPVDLGDQIGLTSKHLHVPLVAAQRQEDADCQPVRREHSAVTGVCVKRGVRRATRAFGEV
ncbi:hypothetical protein D3C71_1387740 [compost metagenome]